jgi:hypothetical protein
MTYSDTRPWAKAIRAAVTSRKMPPWFADPAHGKFENDPRLSSRELETVRAWVDAGAPEGNRADAPKPIEFTQGWKIGKPDLVVSIPVDFEVPKSGTIDYTWFAADMGLTEDKWIERIELRPGARAVVHHALAFAREPGGRFRADLKPGGVTSRPERALNPLQAQNDQGTYVVADNLPGAELLVDYVPNGEPYFAKPGQARLVRAGSHLLFQMHYTANGQALKDRTQVGIVFAKQPPRERVVNNAIKNETLRIPAGAANHEVRAEVPVYRDVLLGGFGPHMHVRGKAMRYELIRPGEEPRTLLYVPAYDFNWQLKYQPVEWIQARKGDRIRVTAWYDNSPNNKHNPDPSKEVFWGDQSWSEMLFGFFDYVIPADADPRDLIRLPQAKVAER